METPPPSTTSGRGRGRGRGSRSRGRGSRGRGCGTTRQSRPKAEKNRGLVAELPTLKKWSAKIPWGAEYAYVDADSEVLQVGWKDAKVVLFMTTVHGGHGEVERLRRRPATTASGAAQTRLIFGEQTTKVLPIPDFIDDYNH